MNRPAWKRFFIILSPLAVILVFVLGRIRFASSASISVAQKGSHPMEYPISPIDKKIDELGQADRVTSEADAEAHIDAILEKFRVDDSLISGLSEFKPRLARAELLSVRDSKKRIPESKLADIFNSFMDEWQTPTWTRISVLELHTFRTVMSIILFPRSTQRLANGDISNECRPVEALYLMYLLESQRGVSPELREEVKAGRWPKNLQKQWEARATSELRPFSYGKAYLDRENEYLTARAKYFAENDVRTNQQVTDLFRLLDIQ